MKSSRGFTVIELLIVVAVLVFASVIFFIQKQNIEIATRDDARRTSINAIYYSLEEVYKPQQGSYPRTVSEKKLPSVDPALFNDPSGNEIGMGESNYRYEPTGCIADACTGYTLRTTMEQEDDYVKTNRTAQ
jgi:prepilin-type N-terminal cleavage/methylation domain-containing protein